MQCRTDESGWGFVDQLRRVYTRRVFEQVQRTVTSATRYRIDDDPVGRKNHYLVSHTRRTNKISWGQHQFKVCADIECQKFTCECRTWEHTGNNSFGNIIEQDIFYCCDWYLYALWHVKCLFYFSWCKHTSGVVWLSKWYFIVNILVIYGQKVNQQLTCFHVHNHINNNNVTILKSTM